MEDFANNAVRNIAVQCAAQSAKTQNVMNCACWAIAEDPGPAMWVTATLRLNVPVVNAMIDTGFKASEVYRFCLGTGWKAMKGDDAEWFLSQAPRTGKTIRRVWRRVLVDPSLGTRRARVCRHLPLFQWSNPSLKDHLALFTHGVVGQWTIPKKTGRDYLDQMTAEVREEREDSRGRVKVLWVQKRRDNHYLDCELMIDVAAIVSGCLKAAKVAAAREGESTA
jgi:phage terminase large subunit GpA-like protein